MKKRILMLDLDGVILGRQRYADPVDVQKYMSILLGQLAEIPDLETVFITDRGVEQLPPLSYMLRGARFHAGESGAVVLDTYKHATAPNRKYAYHMGKVVELQKAFYDRFINDYPLEPGVLSSIRVERVDGNNLSEAFHFLSQLSANDRRFCVKDHGDCVTMRPAGINKIAGIRELERLYAEIGQPLDYKNILWVADGKADIPVAHYIKKRGGTISAVSNSCAKYAHFVCKNQGLMAENAHVAGLVEIVDRYYFQDSKQMAI